jgi:hypothetical protein
MVHFNRTVVVLLHKHFNSWLKLGLILSALSWIVCTLLWASLTLWCMCQQFFRLFWLIMSSFSSVLIIFHKFFTWISLGNIDFCFSPMLGRTANAFEEESKWVTWLHNQRSNHFIHVTDGVTVTSLPASLLQKINEPTDHLCQVTLNKNMFAQIWKVMQTFKLH